MATDIVSEPPVKPVQADDQRNQQAKKRWLLTLLDQEFGPVAAGARPKLTIIAGGIQE